MVVVSAVYVLAVTPAQEHAETYFSQLGQTKAAYPGTGGASDFGEAGGAPDSNEARGARVIAYAVGAVGFLVVVLVKRTVAVEPTVVSNDVWTMVSVDAVIVELTVCTMISVDAVTVELWMSISVDRSVDSMPTLIVNVETKTLCFPIRAGRHDADSPPIPLTRHSE